MASKRGRSHAAWVVPVVLAFTYFVIFPEDFGTLLVPVETLLMLTEAVSPWFYGVVAVAIIAWSITRTRGKART